MIPRPRLRRRRVRLPDRTRPLALPVDACAHCGQPATWYGLYCADHRPVYQAPQTGECL